MKLNGTGPQSSPGADSVSLQTRLFVYFSLIGALFLVTITLLIFNRMENSMVSQLRTQFENDTRASVESVQQSFEQLGVRFRVSSEIPMFRALRFHQLTLNKAAMGDDIRQLELYFLEMQDSVPDLKRIQYVDSNGVEIFHIENSGISNHLVDLSQQQDIIDALKMPKKQIYSTLVDTDYVNELVWWVPVYTSSSVPIGVLGFYFTSWSIFNRLNKLSENGQKQICLYDEKANILYSPQGKSVCSNAKQNYWLFESSISITNLNWPIKIMADPDLFLSEVKQLQWIVLALILPVMILVVFLTVYIISRQITTSIKQLVQAARIMGAGEKLPTLNFKRADELGELAHEITRAANLIEANKQALLDSNNQLEQRVEARTAELNSAMQLAEKASQAKSRFLARMSHEFRTPLNAVLGFAQILEQDKQLSAKTDYRNMLNGIKTAGGHLLSLVNNLLDFDQIEEDKLEMELVSINPRRQIDRAIELVQSLASKQNVRVENLTDKGMDSAVYADRVRLNQVLLNLISNGIKYNKPGGKVTIKAECVDTEWVKIDVCDTGIGLTTGEINNLFQPFNRLGQDFKIEGAGIGLTIAKRLIEKMDGTIEVQSQKGEGSCFSISLPISHDVEDVCPEIGDAENAAVYLKPNIGINKILVAEDEPTNQLIISAMLKHLGIDFDIVNNGQQAISLWQSRTYDIILMDMNMPEMDGVMATKEIRRQENPQDRPVIIIALTANVTSDSIDECMQAGMDYHLTKPIQLRKLALSLEMAISQQFEKTDI